MNLLLGVLFYLLEFHLPSLGNEISFVRPKRQVRDPNEKRVVCYYANWAVYRSGDSKFRPEDIHPHLCTHVIYAFATLEKDVGIVPFDPKQDIQLEGYNKFVDLKKANPNLKLMLSVGGSKEGSARFSKIAADPQLRLTFAKNSRTFLQQFNFDGLDIAWQYPNFTEGSSSSDKENYVRFVMDLRNEYKDDYLISLVVPSLEKLVARGFDIPQHSEYVDFMNVIAYDYHVATEPTVGHVAPLYSIPEDPYKDLNIDSTIKTYKNMGADMGKLNLGIPLYGTFFILEDPEETDIGSSTEDEGDGIQERGAVIYNNFCKKIKEELWTVKHVNKTAVGPYAYKDKQWVAYDDEEMIINKAGYAVRENLGGIMFWTIDMDDFKGLCHSRAFPLIKAGRDAFFRDIKKSTSGVEQTSPRAISSEVPPSRATPPPPRPPPQPRPPQAPARPPQPPARPAPASPPTLGSLPTVRRPLPTFPTPAEPAAPDFPVDNSISEDFESSQDNAPALGNRSFYSNRDMIFQNVRVWIRNFFYPQQQ